MPRHTPLSRWLARGRGFALGVALALPAGCATERPLGFGWPQGNDSSRCANCGKPKPKADHHPQPERHEPATPSPIDFFDPSVLQGKPSDGYLLDKGDKLGIEIDGIPVPPEPAPELPPEPSEKPTESGPNFPAEVQPNGSIELPLIDGIPVRGRTVQEAETLIRHAYTVREPILDPARNPIRVTLRKGRPTRVLVIRRTLPQMTGSEAAAAIPVGWQNGGARSDGTVVTLRAEQCDVARALAAAGEWPLPRTTTAIHVLHVGTRTPRIALTREELRVPTAPRRLADGEGDDSAASRRGPIRGGGLDRRAVRLLTIEVDDESAPVPAPQGPRSPAVFHPASSGRYGMGSDGMGDVTSSSPRTVYVEWSGTDSMSVAPHWVGSSSYRSSGRYGDSHSMTMPFPSAIESDMSVPENFAIVPQGYRTEAPLESTNDAGEAAVEAMPPEDGELRSIRIPIRRDPGETGNVSPRDVVLNDGDVVCLEIAETLPAAETPKEATPAPAKSPTVKRAAKPSSNRTSHR